MQQLIPPQEKLMQCTLVILQVEIPCSLLTRLLELSVSTPIVAMSFPVSKVRPIANTSLGG